MFCEICNRRIAEITLKTGAGGVWHEQHLCRECYAAMQSGLKREKEPRACRYCGRTEDEVLQTLIVGCENCYDEFKDILEPIIERVQKL